MTADLELARVLLEAGQTSDATIRYLSRCTLTELEAIRDDLATANPDEPHRAAPLPEDMQPSTEAAPTPGADETSPSSAPVFEENAAGPERCVHRVSMGRGGTSPFCGRPVSHYGARYCERHLPYVKQ